MVSTTGGASSSAASGDAAVTNLELISANTKTFASISEKLDSQNYLLWCQQVEPVIKAHRLHHFLVNPVIPLEYLSVADATAVNVNPAYLKWEQQDQLLLAWLQSTMSREMLTRVIEAKHAHELWDKVHAYFQIHTQAKSRQLRSELCATTLEGKSVAQFLQKIQSLVDSLEAIGEPVSSREHLDIVLEGLPQDYESTVLLICGQAKQPSIEEVETLLLGHEARMERFRKSAVPTVNMTTANTVQYLNCLV